jgi:ABC-type lipoprotein release transport system permease subunit
MSFLFVAFLSLVLVFVSAGYAALKSGNMNPIQVIKAE